METQILEGTLAEVQRQLSALPFAPETHLRILVTEQEVASTPNNYPFTPTEFRNGLPLLPRRKLSEPITLELVKHLSEDEDEVSLRAY